MYVRDMKIKLNEETISMFLGLVIVVVVVGMIFNFFQKRRGEITIPGVNSDLVLEGNKTTGDKAVVEGEYVVKKGDSLWNIAVANYGDGFRWTEIVKDNELKTTTLEVGQKIKLRAKAEPVKKDTVAEEKVQDSKGVSVDESTYTVVRGDSLWNIAVNKYGDGYKWVMIWQNNKSKLSSPDKLEIGMALVLPKLN
jgi:nucleoid-associated protein YgaU